jgi:uncharacterized membrane protein YfcA
MDFVIGFLIAVVIALTGVGAGTITAPLLILFLKIPVEVAVSTALAYSAVVKLIVVPVQIVRKQVNWKVLGWMVAGGLPGVILGSLLFRHVAVHGPRSSLYLTLGAIIIFTSGWHIFRHFKPAAIDRPKKLRPAVLAATMLPIGAEVGFSSSGAGALGTVALLGLTPLNATQVVGTDLAFGLVIALAGTGVHFFGGTYNQQLLVHMAIGGVVGGIVGSTAAPRIPNRQLRFALSLWLVVIGAQFWYQAFFK